MKKSSVFRRKQKRMYRPPYILCNRAGDRGFDISSMEDHIKYEIRRRPNMTKADVKAERRRKEEINPMKARTIVGDWKVALAESHMAKATNIVTDSGRTSLLKIIHS